MPGFKNRRIDTIKESGIMLEEQVKTGNGQYGSVSKLSSWRKIGSRETICALAVRLLQKNDSQQVVETRPLLSYLMLNANADDEKVRRMVRSALSSYLNKPDSGIPPQELKHWKELLSDVTGDF